MDLPHFSPGGASRYSYNSGAHFGRHLQDLGEGDLPVGYVGRVDHLGHYATANGTETGRGSDLHLTNM